MISKEMFAVVLLGLTGCYSAIALHTGNWPKTINKRQTGSSGCEVDQQLTSVTVDQEEVVSLLDFDSEIVNKEFQSVATTSTLPNDFARLRVNFTADPNDNTKYQMSGFKYIPATDTCNILLNIEFEVISSSSKAVLKVQQANGGEHNVAIISECPSKYYWVNTCRVGTLNECPNSESSLDLLMPVGQTLEQYPKVYKIAESLKNAAGVEWGTDNFDWRFYPINTPFCTGN